MKIPFLKCCGSMATLADATSSSSARTVPAAPPPPAPPGPDDALIEEARAHAAPLLHALRDPAPLTPVQRDLALARAARARDFNTGRGGATVRNVMSVGEALNGRFVEPIAHVGGDPFNTLVRSGLVELIRGRDYIAFCHGEGPSARLTLAMNEAENRFDHADLIIWQEGFMPHALSPTALTRLLERTNDLMVLGPLRHQGTWLTTADGRAHLYHEPQTGHNCALHALNAMAGGPAITKVEFDQFLIEQRLQFFGEGGAVEDDFYRNQPLNDALGHLFDFDNGLQPDVVESVARALLPGTLVTGAPNLDHHGLMALAARVEQTCDGALLFCDNHYVAFRAERDPALGRRWYLIESMRSDLPRCGPAQYLLSTLDDGPCVLLGWMDRAHG